MAQHRSASWSIGCATKAGHPPAFVISESGELKCSLESLCLPLALQAEVEFPVGGPVTLDRGDLVLLVSDGVIEARSAQGSNSGSSGCSTSCEGGWNRRPRRSWIAYILQYPSSPVLASFTTTRPSCWSKPPDRGKKATVPGGIEYSVPGTLPPWDQEAF